MTYTDTRWPWHIKVTRTDGTVTEDDYSDEFEPLGYARQASTQPGVVRVDVSVSFADGEAVALPEPDDIACWKADETGEDGTR